MATTMNQQTLWADINVSLAEDFAIVLDDVQLDYDTAGTTVSGSGMISSGTVDASFTGNAVHWNTGECLPTSGTLVYTPTGGTAMTAEMLATTPADGIVNVTIPPFPAFPYMLFEPCAAP
jgi:hypothetical protein